MATKVTCKCGCGKKFVPKTPTHTYLDRYHQSRAAQKRLRQRARAFSEGATA
jgi:hypothetical protein